MKTIKQCVILSILIASSLAFADLNPVTLKTEKNVNEAILKSSQKSSYRESALEKVKEATYIDESFFVAWKGVAIFPRKKDWEFTGGGEISLGYNWNPSQIALNVGIFQTHSDDYACYETALPIMAEYTYNFKIMPREELTPYVSFLGGVNINTYKFSGEDKTKVRLAGALGCGLKWKIRNDMNLNVGYRFSYIHNDGYQNIDGFGGGHQVNLGIDFSF